MINKQSKILITGGLGFVGSNLARLLIKKRFENVIILSRSKSKIENIIEFQDKIDLVLDDVQNIEKYVDDLDVIFHFASTTDNYAIQEKEPHRDSKINVLGTSYLLDAIKNRNPKIRLIFGSTFFVVGNPIDLPVTEVSHCIPLSLYGATRLCGEHLAYIYKRTFNLNITVIRFTNLYGPYERSANPRKAAFNWMITKALRNDDLPMYGNGFIRRDYLYIEDAVKGAYTVAKHGKNSLYFIGSAFPLSIKELLEKVVKIAGKGRIKSIPIPEFHQNVGIGDFWIDNKKIRSLGWNQAVPIEKGIKKTIDYYKKHPELWVD